jgi:hypothetical protein
MKIITLICLTTALLTSSLLAADENPNKDEPTVSIRLEPTKASVRRKLIEQISILEKRIQSAERELKNYNTIYSVPDTDTPYAKRREVNKDILVASQTQLIQALAELAKICD